MYIRKKGKYYQIVETIEGKQRVLAHLGTVEKIKEMHDLYKDQQKMIREMEAQELGTLKSLGIEGSE